ncbi:nucleolar protein 8 [Mortierella hygrophila]|uniref:Nucleolar protein 8 n=1 Tax=Mortierella hygrophila TaxID=979708 RepID=A0A9P6JZ94_9FUNG|nr:nucleolar protein 8 [Mortierella hygrophila]
MKPFNQRKAQDGTAPPTFGSGGRPPFQKSSGPPSGGFRGGNNNRGDDTRKPFSKPFGGAGAGAAVSDGRPFNRQQGGGSSSSSSSQYHKAGAPDRKSAASSSSQPPAAASSSADLFAEDETAAKPAKVKKPKAPKPPVDPNEHITQRAFIGGLAQDVTTGDVEGRFKSFGSLKDVYLAKDVDGSCRGFGYVTLDTTRKDWSKCMALFNGAKWKGNVLKIEEANKSWQSKRQEDLEVQAKMEKKEQDAIAKKIRRNPIKYAENMSLITEKNMEGKRGWKRGRFGRPVITMKLDRMTYDPSHYKNNAEKLFNLQATPLPLGQLIYEIDENEPVPKGKHLPTEVALAPFLAKSKSAPVPASTATTKSSVDKKEQTPAASSSLTATTSSESSRQVPLNKVDTSGDRAMMASVLAGLDMSPRAMSLDGSDFEDNGDADGGYMEDFGGMGGETNADDLFGDVAMDDEQPAKKISKAERDSRPEDLFGDDDDEEDERNRPSLDFLDDEDESEGEYQEDGDENMESEGEEEDDEDEEEDEEDEEDDEGLDEDTIKAIAQLQGSSSSSGGGLFDSDDDNEAAGDDDDQDTKSDDEDEAGATKFADESNAARLKALETREAELEAVRGKQQQLIASTLANIDSTDKKAGHVVFEDSDDYDSEDYEKLEADHEKKMAKLNKPLKSIFDSDSGSDSEEGEAPKKRRGVKEMFGSDDEGDDSGLGAKFGEPDLGIKEQFEGPGGKALFKMQTKIGTSDSRFQLTKDFLDERIREDDDIDFMAHKERLEGGEYAEGRAGAADIILDEERQVESNVTAEKLQALNVLRAMFGDSAVRSKKKEEDSARKAKGGVGFTTGLTTRYDPDAEPAPAPASVESSPEPDDSKLTVFTDSEPEEEPTKDEPVKEEPAKSLKKSVGFSFRSDEDDLKPEGKEEPVKPVKKSVGFSFGFDEDDLNEDKEPSSSTTAAPVKKDTEITTKFQVSSDLKSLFAPTEGSFKMFGGGDDDEEEDEEEDLHGDVEDDRMDHDDRDEDTIVTAYTEGARTIFTSGADALNRAPLSHSGSLFFFHFKNPSLLKKSNFKTNNKVFMRTGTMDEVTANWEKTRHTMTQEFKRKHKSAARNKARASKRFKNSGPETSNHL